MSEAYLKSLHLSDINVMSSGTIADESRKQNEPHIKPLVSEMEDYGIGKYIKKHPEQLTQSRIDNADINIFKNKLVAEEAKRIAKFPKNTLFWNITDSGEGVLKVKRVMIHWNIQM